MPQAFTHYWTNATWKETAREAGEPLSHTAANVFIERGVEEGDRVYVVTIQKGVLHLLGRLEVGAVVDFDQAAEILEYAPWEATDHLLARECTAMRFDRAVSTEVATRLRFEGGKGPVPLKYKPSGDLDEQTLRGVRRLTAEAADQLDALLAGEPLFQPEWPDLEESDDEEGGDEEVDVLAPLVEYFDACEYAYEIDEDGDLVAFFEEEGLEYPVLGSAVGANLVVSVELPLEVPEARRGAIAEAVVRANSESLVMSFLFDFDSGFVRCRMVVRNEDGSLESETAGVIFKVALHRAQIYTGYLQQVIDDERSPKEAVEEAEAEVDEFLAIDEDDDEDGDADGDEDVEPEVSDEADDELRERASLLAPKIIQVAGRSANAHTFLEIAGAELGVESAEDIHVLLKSNANQGVLQYRRFLADGTRSEPQMVLELEGLYEYAKSKFDENQRNAPAETRLRADVAPGTRRADIIENLLRNAGDQGRRFLFRGDIERDILPHLSDPITAAQSEALVRAAQQAHDLEQALRELRSAR